MRIPQSLINFKQTSHDVSIIIGENGSGKSTLLNDIAKHYYAYTNVPILAIANSIHDKFNINSSKRFKVLRGRQGRKQAKVTIKNAIRNIAKKDIQRLRFASMSLEYVGFDPVIGFKVPVLNEENISKLHDNEYYLPEFSKDEQLYNKLYISESDKEEIMYVLEKIRRLQDDKIIWFSMSGYSFEEVEKFSLTKLFILESKLVKLKLIDPIEVYLSKNNNEISLLDASSGELSLIISIVYLSTIIEHNTVILIDEPENSLHPKWQKEYVKNLLDIFHLYEPKIIIATHSPTIVNGAEIEIENIDIYSAKNFEVTIKNNESNNIEETYYDLFGIITPENRFLSNLLTEKLNFLVEKKITRSQFNHFISKLNKIIYDKRQNELIKGVSRIAESIK